MRLQNKLALATCLLILPTLLVLVLSVASVARERIYASVDESLEAKALSVRAAVAVGGEGLTSESVENSMAGLDRQAARGVSFTLASASGTVLYNSSGDHPSGGIEAWTSSTSSYETLPLDGIKTRVLREPFFGLGRVLGYVEVREPLESADGAVAEIRRALIVGGLGSAATVVFSVYWLAGLLVKPVRVISELSSGIYAAEDFGKRMPEVKSPREVRELTHTLNSMLERMQAMIAAQRSFLAESSHELRRPLTILRTNLDLLATHDLPDEVRSTVEEESRVEASAMSDLISELLILSRGELSSLDPRRVDLSEVVMSSVREFREACQDHPFDQAIAAGVHVLGDAERLKHVIDNLLENAHAYTPPGGKLAISLTRDGDSATLRVIDSGRGIPESDLPYLFDRFFRGEAGQESRTEGFGLGLAIVKQAVDSHQGTITVDSIPGEGTAFEVSIPLLPPGSR